MKKPPEQQLRRSCFGKTSCLLQRCRELCENNAQRVSARVRITEAAFAYRARSAHASDDIRRLPRTAGYSIKNIESIKKEMTNAIADAYLKNADSESYVCASKALKPAFAYIYRNKSEQVTL